MKGVTERGRHGLVLWAIVILLAVLMGSAAHAWVRLDDPLQAAGGKPWPYDPNQITVKFATGVDRQRAADVIQDHGCSVAFASRFTPGLFDLRIPQGADFRQVLLQFAKRPDVQHAEPCYLDYPAFVPNDPSYPVQWHFQQVGLPTAWDVFPARGNSTVTVTVLDTGVAYENYSTYLQAPDLAGLTFVSPYDAVDGDGHPNDTNAHGTHVTGTIAQKTNNLLGGAGTADGVRIMPVRTLGAGGGSHAQFSDGVHWATDNGANIINYSGGGSDSTTKHDAVIYAQTNGVLFIAAMGNDGVENPATGYPGRYAEAMGVIATRFDKTRSWYSNWGADADISGPGGDTGVDQNGDGSPDGVLQQTYNTSNDPSSGFGLLWYQGTSMATPHVSGLAALLWSEGTYDAGLSTAASVRNRIEVTAEDLGAAGEDNGYGWGLIRADRALSPSLLWAGTAGYETDGVDPGLGAPHGVFTFKVRYQHGNGVAPGRAKCRIEKLVCAAVGGVEWKPYKNLDMFVESGSSANGAIYSATTTLGNFTCRYHFDFTPGAGWSFLASPPMTFTKQGPLIVAPPKLCWVASSGFGTDGVHPNSGPVGTTFKFGVLYTDSNGATPTVANVIIRRDGNGYKTQALTPATSGDNRTGRLYTADVPITKTGAFTYRFLFRDASGAASGTPTQWQAGPVITGGAAAATLTALTAAPTPTGAQITFSLSADSNVTATVMNVAGRPIKTIVADRPLSAGLQTLVWTGQADTGLAAPAGLYLIKVTLRGAEGAQGSAVTSVRLR